MSLPLTKVRKHDAIKYIIDNGSYCSEWQEAGLFNAIKQIMNDQVYDSKEALDDLVEKAKRY